MTPLATLSVSSPRRLIAVVALAGLVVMMAAAALVGTTVAGRVLPLIAAAAMGWGLIAFWKTGAGQIVLTDTGLFDDAGRCLCTLDNIERIERGAFAVKPSNGFVLRLHAPQGRGWVPGLWWRMGRRLGVGGITRPAEAKKMADLLAMRLMGVEARSES
ncbi:MAG: hypothetical protein ACK5IB_13835 [Qingshengfaniella sp.]